MVMSDMLDGPNAGDRVDDGEFSRVIQRLLATKPPPHDATKSNKRPTVKYAVAKLPGSQKEMPADEAG
jgi:hypothetical protein